MEPTTAERYRGCLLGGAVGDALGAPVEFLTLGEIRSRFGPGGIRDYVKAFGRLGSITDDTQMTLFTAEGLLRAFVRLRQRGIGPAFESVTAFAYLRWLHTQGRRSPLSPAPLAASDLASGWLVGHRELFALRAPGETCLSALEAMRVLGEPAANNSKGCGGIMRIAPVGLFMHALAQTDPQSRRSHTFQVGANIAGLTHGHPTGRLASGAFALIVLCVLEGASLPEAMAAAQAELRKHADFEETSNAIARAERTAASGLPGEAAVRELGEGWTAEESLAIALYCALTAPGFEEGVILAVNHDGDSDSTGSLAGNLLGLMHGEDGIPRRWLEPLELRAVIAGIATDLATCRDWDLAQFDHTLDGNAASKYPGY